MKRNDDFEDLDEAGCSDRSEGADVDGIAETVGRALGAEEDRENLLLRWFRALDLQVIGACREDERIKPFLKLNLSVGAAEDHLMAQLNQHFDAAEVGMLIRCLCVPLVLIRVGKVNKIGNMLFPTNLRGNLNLMLSPLSDMRIFFCGDDGCNERLGIIFHNSVRSEALVEVIAADSSGRSFLLKLHGDQVLYFWCCEKSKISGSELIEKMKNLFIQRPSLSQLTGISESRLDSFASYLMMNVFSSTNTMESKSNLDRSSSSSFLSTASCHSLGLSSQSLSTLWKPPRIRPGQVGKTPPLYQGSLSPRLNAFKDGPNRVLLLRNGVREKLKRRGDHNSSPLVTEITSVATSSLSEKCSSYHSVRDNERDVHNCSSFSTSSPALPSTLPFSSVVPLSFHHPFPILPGSSLPSFSPYYCWCPPSSTSQHMATPSCLPPFPHESMKLPPLSSLVPTAGPSLFLPTQPSCEPNELPALDLPALLPTSSFVSVPTSQQILSFTPFIAEPIVHIPLMEVCSSGPGYLVSAGPAITSTIPLLPKLGGLPPETESMAEKNARETLRMLMASTPSNPQLMKVLPAVLTSVDENLSYIHGRKQGLVGGGSRGLYTGSKDVDAVACDISRLVISSASSVDACHDFCDDVECSKCGDHISEDDIEDSKSDWN